MFTEYVKRTRKLVEEMSSSIFGIGFGLFLHYDMHLTLPKILQLNQATMQYEKGLDLFRRKVVLRNPFVNKDIVKVMRLAPPRCQLEPRIREIETTIGVEPADNGIARRRPFIEGCCPGDGISDQASCQLRHADSSSVSRWQSIFPHLYLN